MADFSNMRMGEAVAPRRPDRLESWKEIAAYLKRDVRTVQRWEKREGLPVHRLVHDKLGSVYAHAEELDAWWNSRRPALDEQTPALQEPPASAPIEAISPDTATADETSEPVIIRSRRRLWHWVVVSVVILMAAAVVIWRWNTPRQPTGAGGDPNFTQVTVVDSPTPRISPDGRWMAYRDRGSQHLFLRDLRNGNSRVLLSEPTEANMAWSRDSRRIAVVTRADAAVMQMEEVTIESGERRTLWQGAAAALMEPLDWSRDGQQLLCRVREPEGRFQLSFISLSNRTIKSLATFPAAPASARLSPDSRFVVYTLEREHNYDVFLLPVDGGAEVRLTDHPGRDSLPFWTPDGRYVIFMRRRGSSARLWAVRIDPRTGARAAAPVTLTTPGTRNFPIGLAADGSLYFSRRNRSPQVALLQVDTRTRASAPAVAAPFEDDTLDPSWSRDGKLVYRKQLPTGESLLAERNLGSGQESLLRVPHSHDVTFFLRASQAGVFSFYGSEHGEQPGFYEYSPRQEQLRLLWKLEAEEPLAPVSWAPGGNDLLFSTWPAKDGRFPVKVLRPGGKAETLVYSGSRPFPRWSPDGHSVAYTDKNCLMTIRRSGGGVKQVLCQPDTILPRFALFSIGALDWLPDGSGIAWTVHNEPERRIEMWVVDVSSGAHWVAWKGEKEYASWPADPAWSPDARHLAFRMDSKPEYEVWRLSHFLPQ